MDAFALYAGDAWMIRADHFRETICRSGALTEAMLAQAQSDLESSRQFASSASLPARHRLAQLLVMLGKADGSGLLLNQEELGQLTGLQRTTVNEIMSSLRRDGLIRYTRGRIHVLDPEALAVRAGAEAPPAPEWRRAAASAR